MNPLLQDDSLTEKTIRLEARSITLTLIEAPERFLEQLSREDSQGRLYLPYWTYLWESAIALARQVKKLDNQLKNAKALELGCGFGLTGIAACQVGATVIFTDTEYDALRFARHNAEQNGVAQHAEFVQMDWNAPSFNCKFAYILAADVIYEEHHWTPIVTLLQHHLTPQGIALFSEPNRNNAIGFFHALCDNGFTYQKCTYPIELNGNTITVGIYTVQRASDFAYGRPVLL